MSRINVNINKIKNTSTELSNVNKELNNLAEAVLTIQKGIPNSMSQSKGIIRRMNSIETNILEEAVRMKNMAKALIYIAEQYGKTENRIISNANGNLSIFTRISDYIKNGIIKVLDILNLDDDYYRHIMEQEKFNAEKTQEKLMDQYLQYSINNMLNEDRFSEDTWNKASAEERKTMLTEFLIEINAIMGTSVSTQILFENNLAGTGKRGYYSYPEDTVTINPDYLNPTHPNSYMIMRTMIHEMRHAYQYAVVDRPDDFLVSEETREKWAYNFKYYKDPDIYGYDAYVEQAIEYDAKNFAEQYGDIAGHTPEYAGSWE